jgi:hypothetical protein
MAKTYTAAGTVVAGEVYTAAAHNIIANDVNNLIVPPSVKVVRTSDTSYTSATSITWQSVSSGNAAWDTDGMWAAGDPTKITFNTSGIYSIVFQFFMSGTSLANCLSFVVANNSTIFAEMDYTPPTTTQALATVSGIYNAAAADYIQARVQYTGTGTMKGTTVPSYLSATWIGRTS